jgi:hypothetical protein
MQESPCNRDRLQRIQCSFNKSHFSFDDDANPVQNQLTFFLFRRPGQADWRRRLSHGERRSDLERTLNTGSHPRPLLPPGVSVKARFALSLFILALPLSAKADQLVSAGSLIQCTISEGNISSKTTQVGDPVMCQLGHTEMYGRNSFPYGSYVVGHFAAYKDPGHFVGKGWMELDFDRLVVQPDTVIPINARVVAAPRNPVDKDGKILGTGHATRDTVEWLIPVLWPIDLINLPRRGPRPVLKAESKLTLKVMDDFGIPTPQENAVRTPALVSRQTPDEPTYQTYREQAAPIERAYAQPPMQQYPPQQQYAPQQGYAPVVVNLVQPAQQQQQPIIIQQQAPQQQPVYIQQQAQQQPIIVQQAPPVVYNHYPPPPPPAYGPYRYYYRGY